MLRSRSCQQNEDRRHAPRRNSGWQRLQFIQGHKPCVEVGRCRGEKHRERLSHLYHHLSRPADAVASIDICRGHYMVGTVAFDQQGQTLRMVLHAGYFYERDISVREFAEAVFKHYKVHRDEVTDDACFQDVTCFRGRTDAREQFLILKIGGETQLYVRPLRPGSEAEVGIAKARTGPLPASP